MKPLSERDGLIVCFGKTICEPCASAIDQIAHQHPQYHLQFVMSDWIAADQLANASVFWIVDAATEIADIAPALKYGTPLLVPEGLGSLRDACIASHGLFYQTEQEAMSSLIHLVSARQSPVGVS
jgi:hypothetical protein